MDDSPLRRAVEGAQERGVPYVLIEQRHLAQHDLALAVDDAGVTGTIVAAGARMDLARVDAVYLRPLDLPAVGDRVDRLRAEAFHTGLLEWAEIAGCVVLNRPSAMESNSSKPFQLQRIAPFGFRVPETLVTSDPDAAREFRHRHGRAIFKSVSGIRSIVRELDDQAAARLERITLLPTMFQQYVPGVDVRVHVVGTQVFATEIRSAATDYRYAAQDGTDVDLAAVELPDDVAERCVRLADGLGLPLCGIDLRQRSDGQWFCFEVNPMPAYSYYESNTGQPIADAIIDTCLSRTPVTAAR
jgi:glutathione synthase/RimK-type ligase-like ATP-grasp enzyme